jgi:hypothetical protein
VLKGAALQGDGLRELLEGQVSLSRQADGVAGQGGEVRKQRAEAVAESSSLGTLVRIT